MPRILVFQHVAHEILGTLDPLLRGSGFRIRYVNFGRSNYKIPDIGKYDGLIILGGPMNVDQTKDYPYLEPELVSIKKALELDKPILGICLGSQLLAKALGSKVGRNGSKEIGWYNVYKTEHAAEDHLLQGFREVEKIFQWHGDTFEIPDGAVRLAGSDACKNQAFRYGDNVYGFQFHLEVDKDMINRWLVTPGNKKELESLKGIIDPEVIRKETPDYIEDLMKLSDNTFSRFIELFGNIKKKEFLPSR